MKVLILTTVLAPYRVDLFNEIGKYCDLTVCFEQELDSSRNEKWYSRTVTGFNAVYLKNWSSSLRKVKWDVLRVLGNSRYDIALSYEYSTPTAALFMLGCIYKRIPYLVNCDGAFINKHPIKDAIKRFFISRAHRCLANGVSAREYFRHYGAPDTAIRIHNFSSLFERDILHRQIDRSKKAELKMKLGLEDKPTAVAVGQFIYRKGFDVLITSWAGVRKDYNLLIIGDGVDREKYNNLIRGNNLSNVSILDFVNKETLFEYYQACDLFVLPTREDVWGLVINEAMACGLPVVTTDKCIAGLELVSDYENGFIVPVDEPEVLSERINEILEKEDLRLKMSKVSLRKIQEYTIERLASNHVEVFEEIKCMFSK